MIQSYSNEPVCSPLRGMDTQCLFIASLVLISTALTACGVRGDKSSMPAKEANVSAAATPLTSGGIAPILLFNGTGTSPGDVAAIGKILNSNRLSYTTGNST